MQVCNGYRPVKAENVKIGDFWVRDCSRKHNEFDTQYEWINCAVYDIVEIVNITTEPSPIENPAFKKILLHLKDWRDSVMFFTYEPVRVVTSKDLENFDPKEDVLKWKEYHQSMINSENE